MANSIERMFDYIKFSSRASHGRAAIDIAITQRAGDLANIGGHVRASECGDRPDECPAAIADRRKAALPAQDLARKTPTRPSRSWPPAGPTRCISVAYLWAARNDDEAQRRSV